MIKQKYTLDRIEDGFFVFLKYEAEEHELILSANQVHAELEEGDIVEITIENSIYHITPLIEETEVTLERVNSLLEKLKNKKY